MNRQDLINEFRELHKNILFYEHQVSDLELKNVPSINEVVDIIEKQLYQNFGQHFANFERENLPQFRVVKLKFIENTFNGRRWIQLDNILNPKKFER